MRKRASWRPCSTPASRSRRGCSSGCTSPSDARCSGAFLDALKLAHEDGILKEEADAGPPVSEADARAAVAGLASFPADQVRTYLNTLWLQDSERWAALEGLYSAEGASTQSSG